MKNNTAVRDESIQALRDMLKPGDIVYTILRSVSRSGMYRRISLVVGRGEECRDITFHVARALDEPLQQRGQWVQDSGIGIGGYGMDMGFKLIYNLGCVLYPDGFGIPGTNGIVKDMRPVSKEKAAQAVAHGYIFHGRNGDTSGWDNYGGYALNHRWL